MNWTPKIVYNDMADGLQKSFTFDFPPSGDPFSETIDHDVKRTISSNGKRQYQYNSGRKIYSVKFQFQSESTKDKFKEFFGNHAVKGGTFNYYPSSDETEYEEWEMDIDSVKLDRIIPTNTPGQFYYDFEFKMSKLL